MDNFKLESIFQEESIKNRYYKLQPDKLKNKKYIYCSFPLVYKNSIEISDLRSLVYSDVYARYQTLNGDNALFNVGINNTNTKLYESVSNNVLSKEDPYSNIKEKSYSDLYSIDVGFDLSKKTESHSKEFIHFAQDAFLKLYKFRHIVREEDDYYLDFSSIKDNVLTEIVKDNVFEELKDILDYQSGLTIEFNTTTNFPIETQIGYPEFLAGVNFIAIRHAVKNRHFYLESEKEYINEAMKNKKNIGIFSGNFAYNPITNQEIPIIITNYFKEEVHIGLPCMNDRDLLFSSIIGLEYLNVLSSEKTLINSLFLNDLTISEAKKKVVEYCVNKGIAQPYESVNNTKLLLSEQFSDGISIPSYESNIVSYDELPVLIDNKNSVRTINSKLPSKKMTNKVFTTPATQAFLSIASRLKNEVGITYYSSTEFVYDFKEYSKFDFAIFHSKEDYLYTLVLNMILLKSIHEDTNNIFKKFYIENNIEVKSNLIEINAINNKYGACSLRLDLLSVPLNENYYYNVEFIENHFKSVESFKEVYEYDFLTEFKDLDTDFKNLVNNCTECIEEANMTRYIGLIKNFINKVHQYKKITQRQAKGLLILYSVLAPGITEGIYKQKFKSNYPLMFESWPW